MRFDVPSHLIIKSFIIALWPIVGKELSPWRMWHSFVSVPDHCLFIYFKFMQTVLNCWVFSLRLDKSKCLLMTARIVISVTLYLSVT